jgi:dihydroorotase
MLIRAIAFEQEQETLRRLQLFVFALQSLVYEIESSHLQKNLKKVEALIEKRVRKQRLILVPLISQNDECPWNLLIKNWHGA